MEKKLVGGMVQAKSNEDGRASDLLDALGVLSVAILSGKCSSVFIVALGDGPTQSEEAAERESKPGGCFQLFAWPERRGGEKLRVAVSEIYAQVFTKTNEVS